MRFGTSYAVHASNIFSPMGTRGKKKKDFDNCYGLLKTAGKIYILEEIEGFDRNTESLKSLLFTFQT